MTDNRRIDIWQPITQNERIAALDALRGLALFGVLLVNLLGDFRQPLAEQFLDSPAHDATWADSTVNVVVAALLEFKAFALFSFLFGIGLAVFAERAATRQVGATYYLIRRLVMLLALGLCHMLLVWNGDILALYAVCGLLLLPLLRISAAPLALTGVVAIALRSIIPWDWLGPNEDTLHHLASEAARVYRDGSFGDVLVFHWHETSLLILPLLVFSLPKTWGLMALGVAAWRAGVMRDPERHLVLLWTVTVVGGIMGGALAVLSVSSKFAGITSSIPPFLIEAGSAVPLALAYAAGLLLALRSSAAMRAVAPFAAVGQMALTNYLVQSAVLSFLFFGYGLGLFGRVGSAAAAAIGVAIYVAQVAFSRVWLRSYRYGPVEWLWRTLTYGRRQPLRRAG